MSGNRINPINVFGVYASNIVNDTTLAGGTLKALLEAYVIAADGSVAMTGDLDMGGNKITDVKWPTAAMDAVSKEYVDQGRDWQESVTSIFDNAAALPVGPSDGDRYIAGSTANGWTANYIYQYNAETTSWKETIPTVGTTLKNEDTSTFITFGGASWTDWNAEIDHGAMLGLADDDHTQYILEDGTRAFSGDIDIGGNAITNVGNVDGRDLSTDGSKLDGIEAGADVTDSVNVDSSGAVMEADYDANTIMAADSDDTPAALTIAEQTLVGRITAGNIAGLTATQVRTLLNVEDGADVTDAINVDSSGAVMEADFNANTILTATTDDNPTALTITEESILGRLTGGSIAPITVAESRILGRASGGSVDDLAKADVLTILNVEDGADVTDATNVDAAGAVMEADFDANTILAANTDDTPAAVTVDEQTLVGRITAGNIAALQPSDVRTLLNVEDGADVTDATNVDAAGAVMEADYNANTILAADSDDTPAPVTVAAQTLVGRVTAGNIAALDVSTVLTLLNVEGGADVTDATNVDAAGAVMEADFDAQTLLAATLDNTPAALTIGESTIVGRASGGNVAALAKADVLTILNVEDGADVTDAANVDSSGAVMEADYDAHTILAANTDDTPAAVTVAEQTLVGRITAGNIDALTATEVRTLLNIEDGADVTDATNVDSSGAVMEADFNAYTVLAANTDDTPAPLTVGVNNVVGRIAGDIASLAASDLKTILGMPLHNYMGTMAPGAGDDSGDGYSVGSIWVDVNADEAYICLDSALGAAVWKKITYNP